MIFGTTIIWSLTGLILAYLNVSDTLTSACVISVNMFLIADYFNDMIKTLKGYNNAQEEHDRNREGRLHP
jgi:hypothetical protein